MHPIWIMKKYVHKCKNILELLTYKTVVTAYILYTQRFQKNQGLCFPQGNGPAVDELAGVLKRGWDIPKLNLTERGHFPLPWLIPRGYNTHLLAPTCSLCRAVEWYLIFTRTAVAWLYKGLLCRLCSVSEPQVGSQNGVNYDLSPASDSSNQPSFLRRHHNVHSFIVGHGQRKFRGRNFRVTDF